MTPTQWEKLISVIECKVLSSREIGFMVDSPWLPGWAGFSTLDYYTSYDIWMRTNLNDIVGFVGEEECREFVVPYLKRIYGVFESKVRFFHNDSYGLTCAPFLSEIGINLFNFTFDHSIDEMRAAAGPHIALLGNLPPRDVLAAATPEVVYASTQAMMRNVRDRSRMYGRAEVGCHRMSPPKI